MIKEKTMERSVSGVEHGRTAAAVQRQQVDVVDGVRPSSAERPSKPTADSSVAAPDGGYGWVVVFAAFAISFIFDGIMQSFGVFYVELLDYFGADKARTSLIGSVSNAVAYGIGLPAGVLVNRYGTRPVTVVGSVIATVGLVISRFAGSVVVLVFTFGVIVGFGFGLMYLPSLVAVSIYFDKRRALATGITMCGSGVGNFVMAPVSSVLFQYLDWRSVMFVFAALILQGCVFGALFRPLALKSPKPGIQSPKASADALTSGVSTDIVSQEVERLQSAERTDLSSQSEGVPVTRKKPSRLLRAVHGSGLHLLTNLSFLCMFIGNLVASFGFLIPYYFITDRAILLRIKPTQAAFLLSLIGLSNTAGRVVIGFLADLKRVSPLTLHNAAALSAGVAGLLMRYCVVYWAMVVYALFHGLCLASWMTMTTVVLCNLVGIENLPTSLGMVSLVRGLAGAAGPPLTVAVASLFTESNVYDVSFTIAGVEFLVSGAVFCLIPALQRRRRGNVSYYY